MTKKEKEEKESMEKYINDLQEAFTDVLDGNSSWWDIKAQTGLSDKRCKEISDLFEDAMKKFG